MEKDRPTIEICIKCRVAGDAPEPISGRAGSRLFRAMERAAAATEFSVAPVECFAVCRRPVTIGLPRAGGWSFLYGDFAPDSAATPDEIFEIARRHLASETGIVAKEARTVKMREAVIARFPARKEEPGA